MKRDIYKVQVKPDLVITVDPGASHLNMPNYIAEHYAGPGYDIFATTLKDRPGKVIILVLNVNTTFMVHTQLLTKKVCKETFTYVLPEPIFEYVGYGEQRGKLIKTCNELDRVHVSGRCIHPALA